MHTRFAPSPARNDSAVGKVSPSTRRQSVSRDRTKRYGMLLGVGAVAELQNMLMADTREAGRAPNVILVTPPTPRLVPRGEDDSDVPELDSATSGTVSDDDQSLLDEAPPLPPKDGAYRTCTPAEHIVNCYRAGMSPEDIQDYAVKTEQQVGNDIDLFGDSFDSMSISSVDSGIALSPDEDCFARIRIVDTAGLSEARNEAYSLLKQSGLNEDSAIACPRADCRNVVQDVKALIAHMHIHNLHDLRFKCSNCSRAYGHRWELSAHTCPALLSSNAPSPSKSMFSVFARRRSF
ncbi:hypothetical protein PTI98_010350 [Pleurotus ostreatus]|nr:hypothetical protein PTI98_010350 [Pleurotus ostreatus]